VSRPFPPAFRFGVATADHQCEAYTGQDDIRDVWERVRGLVPRGRATDFWNRYREDVDLARGLGCTAFRLSLSWARLEPSAGGWDDAAFAHYRDLLQYIRDAGMVSVVTLHHNTWPLHVQAAGGGAGMLDPGFPDRLAAFASVVAERLGDLVDYYVTINEPNQLVYGYVKGWWMRAYPVPPGLEPFATSTQQIDALLLLIPNLFRAHARARAAIRKIRPNAPVGTNPLVLGLPRWLQRWVDRRATRLKNPDDLRSHAILLSQRDVLERGAVDVSIAQLTMTQTRMDQVLFSEPYLVAHLCALHARMTTLPATFGAWIGRVGVAAESAPEQFSQKYFPAAAIRRYADGAAAVDALRRGDVDLVFDDDVVLRAYVTGDFQLTPLRGHDQPFAVAIGLGSRSLLNAVDIAVRQFKRRDAGGSSPWERAMEAAFPGETHGEPPHTHNRKSVAHVGKAESSEPDDASAVPDMDRSLQEIRRRGVLRVGIHPGVPGLCAPDPAGEYRGLEPDLARYIASRIFAGVEGRVKFVRLHGNRRLSATRSWLQWFDGIRKSLSMFATLLGTNWWNLGMAGRLAPFLCPAECVGAIDFVGLDYYWGIPSLRPSQIQRLCAASECRYANAPVWPAIIHDILREQQEQFPGKPIILIENGCTTTADGIARADYIARHLRYVQRAVDEGVPVAAYLCWSITSNREWGLPFDNASDFGLYHIDLDHDPNLTRVPTPASERYKEIITARSAEV
jgi:beta-glucosidase/6-phospho-beta-glucosidase/beta-galactosidase/ABC-type amino acid transport substrate-binding protein